MMMLRRPLQKAVARSRVARCFTQKTDTGVSAEQAALDALKKYQEKQGQSIEQKLAAASQRKLRKLGGGLSAQAAGQEQERQTETSSPHTAAPTSAQSAQKEQTGASSHATDASTLRSSVYWLRQNQAAPTSSPQEAAAHSLLKKAVDTDQATLQELLVSPLERYKLQKMDEYRKKRLEANKKQIDEAEQSGRRPVEWKRQFLKHREFFTAIEQFKYYLVEHHPDLAKRLSEEEFFEDFHPMNFTPESLKMPPYPGTIKGLRPEDDPEYFAEWLRQNLPPRMLKAAELLSEKMEEALDDGRQEAKEPELNSTFIYDSSEYAFDSAPHEEALYEDPDLAMQDNEDGSDYVITNRNDAPFEFMTSSIPMQDQKFQPGLEKWQIFNALWMFDKLKKTAPKTPPGVEEIEARKGTYRRRLQISDQYYPTVAPYLELLPQEFRSSKHIRTIANLIDKHWFNVSTEKRQEMLNFAVHFLLPHEDWLDDIYASANQAPEYPTSKHVLETILTDEKVWHEGGFMTRFKPTNEDIIKIKAAVDKVDGEFSWPKPFDTDKVNSQTPYIPDDYYDNEDGFWDGFKKAKFERRAKLPIMKVQPYYKH